VSLPAANSPVCLILQILEVMSPAREQHVDESSEDSSDAEDDTPLFSLLSRRPPQPANPIKETSPPPTADLGDYSDRGEIEIPNMGNLMSRAMQSLDNVTEVSMD